MSQMRRKNQGGSLFTGTYSGPLLPTPCSSGMYSTYTPSHAALCCTINLINPLTYFVSIYSSLPLLSFFLYSIRSPLLPFLSLFLAQVLTYLTSFPLSSIALILLDISLRYLTITYFVPSFCFSYFSIQCICRNRNPAMLDVLSYLDICSLRSPLPCKQRVPRHSIHTSLCFHGQFCRILIV